MRKLLVVAGAGSTLDFGMPSSQCIHNIFLRLAAERYPLNSDQTQNLYAYLYDKLERYWLAQGVPQKPNFEDMFHVITQLAAMPPDPSVKEFTPALSAFVEVCQFPEVGFGLKGTAVDSNTMRSLADYLVYGLVDEIRKRCLKAGHSTPVLRRFFDLLTREFDVAVVTTNYDDLIYRALPSIETGFDLRDNGLFKEERILGRTSWPCLLHLHGSIHFDEVPNGNLSAVRWNDALTAQHFYQSPGSSTPHASGAGYVSPASPVIAGYGKAEKISARPYRTYYSELDRLVYKSEALLILGHSLGFGDAHLRQAFFGYTDERKRRAVVVDHACGKLDEHSTATRMMYRFGNGVRPWLASHSVEKLRGLKAAHELERCSVGERHLSIWYSGMLDACNNGEKIVAELKAGAWEPTQ